MSRRWIVLVGWICTTFPAVPVEAQPEVVPGPATQPTTRPATQPAQPPGRVETGEAGEDAYKTLIARLSSADPGERRVAAAGLGRLGDRRATAALVERLKLDPTPAVRAAAATALGALGAERAAEALLFVSRTDSVTEVRTAALKAFKRVKQLEKTGGYGPTGGAARRRTRELTHEEKHRLLLRTNLEYQMARKTKTQGIVLSSIGAGLGIGLLGLSFIVHMARDPASKECYEEWNLGPDCVLYGNCKTCVTTRKPYFSEAPLFLFVMSCVSLTAGLAIGVPLAVSGSRTMSKIISRPMYAWVPQLDLAALPGGAHLGARWRF